MSIYDRWHKSCPDLGAERCRQHKMVPSSVHGQGDRWQVRWRDENGKQCKRNFVKKEGKDPELHADAFDVKVSSLSMRELTLIRRSGTSRSRSTPRLGARHVPRRHHRHRG